MAKVSFIRNADKKPKENSSRRTTPSTLPERRNTRCPR